MSDFQKMYDEVKANLQEGDLVFTAIDIYVFRRVAQDTGSWTSHIGMAVKEEGEWFIMESSVPTVKLCPLRDYLKRTANNRVAVKRYKDGLTEEQVEALKFEGRKHLGKWYHLGFKYDSSRMFCSKFIHVIYKVATGIEVGKLKTLKALFKEQESVDLDFWRFWYGFTSLSSIPWEMQTVTPAEQLNDPQFSKVYEN